MNVKTVVVVAGTMAPAVVHTTVADGLNAIPLIPVVAQPAVAGVVTPTSVKVVSTFFELMKLSDVKVRVSTPFARAAVALPTALSKQLAEHATVKEESSENPTSGIAT